MDQEKKNIEDPKLLFPLIRFSEEYPLVRFSEFALDCQYSYCGPESVNGGECCWHPCQETSERPSKKGRKHGCCWMGSCPLLYEVDMWVLKNWDPDLYREYQELLEDNEGMNEKNLTIWDYGGSDWMVLKKAEDKLEHMEKVLQKSLISMLKHILFQRVKKVYGSF